MGGFLNGATDQELTVYYAKVAGRHFDLALDVLMDMIHSPLLDEREFEKERRVVLEELSSASDSPSQLADLLIDATLWPSHPLGRDIGGTVESVSAITLDMTRSYLRRQYVPNNVVVAIAGDPQAVDHQRAVDTVRRTLGDWPSGDPASWIPATIEDSGRNEPICAVRYKQTEQAHLDIAFIGLPMDHPDRHALSLLSVMLGEGMRQSPIPRAEGEAWTGLRRTLLRNAFPRHWSLYDRRCYRSEKRDQGDRDHRCRASKDSG